MKNDADKVADIYKKIAAFEEAKPNLDADSKAYLEQVYYGLGYYYSKLGNAETAKQYFNLNIKKFTVPTITITKFIL